MVRYSGSAAATVAFSDRVLERLLKNLGDDVVQHITVAIRLGFQNTVQVRN